MKLPSHKLQELDYYIWTIKTDRVKTGYDTSALISVDVVTLHWKRKWWQFWKRRKTIITQPFYWRDASDDTDRIVYTRYNHMTELYQQLEAWREMEELFYIEK